MPMDERWFASSSSRTATIVSSSLPTPKKKQKPRKQEGRIQLVSSCCCWWILVRNPHCWWVLVWSWLLLLVESTAAQLPDHPFGSLPPVHFLAADAAAAKDRERWPRNRWRGPAPFFSSACWRSPCPFVFFRSGLRLHKWIAWDFFDASLPSWKWQGTMDAAMQPSAEHIHQHLLHCT